jgi:hypothetical protein
MSQLGWQFLALGVVVAVVGGGFSGFLFWLALRKPKRPKRRVASGNTKLKSGGRRHGRRTPRQ